MAAMPSNAEPPWGVPPPGYRLPEQTRLGAVRLQVADLQRSLAYYQEIIGLRVIEAAAGRATLGPVGANTPLLELRERPGATRAPRHGRLGLYHFALLLPDRAALGRFFVHLSHRGERVGAADHLVSEALYLRDPDGHGVEVYADRPRSSWQHTGGELAMATHPLDLHGLAQTAQGAPWTGMPPGTIMGHIHLHVGDLDLAEAFYHRALGLDKTVWTYPGALFLSAGGYHHHLGTNTWAVGATPAGANEARLLEWELVVPHAADVAAALNSLVAAGYPVEPDAESGGGRVADPWGTVLRIRPA
jgi:catechol 2,3-dioxygenase